MFYRARNPHNISTIQETQFIVKEVPAWTLATSSRNRSLIGQWNGLLKAQLKHQYGGNSLQRWGASSFTKPETAIWSCVCSRNYTWSWEKGVEVGVAPSVIIFKDPPEDYVVPNPGTLGFTELEVWVPKGSTLSPGDRVSPIKPQSSAVARSHSGLLVLGNQHAAGVISWLNVHA